MFDVGLDYMTTAARAGDVPSMLYLAKAYDTGLNLGSDRKVILISPQYSVSKRSFPFPHSKKRI